jgi:uncharacterized protein YPO0396
LGLNNRDKLSLFQKQAEELADKVSALDRKIKTLSEMAKSSLDRVLHCQTLVNMQWQEIDALQLIERISVIEKQIRDTREGNNELAAFAKQIDEQKSLRLQAEKELLETKAEYNNTLSQIKEHDNMLTELQNDPSIVPLTPFQKSALDERYAQISEHIRLETLENITRSVERTLNKELEEINHSIARCEKQIESIFADFIRTWPTDAADFDKTLSSAPDFFSKLARLEIDGLPEYEQRFFDLLRDQSNQNLAALSSHLNNERRAILERMVLVNESLRQVPFNQTLDQNTYLHINASDRQLPDVREFKQNIQQALSNAWSEDRELAETRFLTLRKIVEDLSSQDPEQKRWRELVLDVRQHVEFIGLEIDENGVEVEIYRSGAGKSGGQRQKLATTCLAAALRYQLGGNERGVPMYAPVILDEAFDKADNEFTALAMNIFNNFGFQMIVATPLKSVMTLEPFIGGACFVDIKDRQKSSVLMIEYDNDRQRLDIPVNARSETDNEVS